jgi:hypothetical protein
VAAYLFPILGIRASWQRHGPRQGAVALAALAVLAGLSGSAAASAHGTTAGLGRAQTGLSASTARHRTLGDAGEWDGAPHCHRHGQCRGWHHPGSRHARGDASNWSHGAGGKGSSNDHASSVGTSGPSTTAEQETADAAIAAAIIGAGALLGAGLTLVQNRSTARQHLTHERVARISDFDIPTQAVMSSFLRQDPESGRSAWTRLNESSTLGDRLKLHQIVAFPNALEALANMYNDNLLDKDIVEGQAETLASGFWKVAEKWWLPLMRPLSDSKAYDDLNKMLADLKRRKEQPLWRRQLRDARRTLKRRLS